MDEATGGKQTVPRGQFPEVQVGGAARVLALLLFCKAKTSKTMDELNTTVESLKTLSLTEREELKKALEKAVTEAMEREREELMKAATEAATQIAAKAKEQTAFASGKRLAYVVAPTYDWTELSKDVDANVVTTLIACGLLPGSLKNYGRGHDVKAFSTVLESHGFNVLSVQGFLRAKIFKDTLKNLVEQCESPDDVFVLVFCGHGHQELFTHHASLVMSDNKHVTSLYLDSELSKICGTVYTVFNCCNAEAVPMALPIGSSVAPSINVSANMRAYGELWVGAKGHRRIDIFSTSSTEKQKALEDGTAFARAFASVLGDATQPVPLKDLEEKLQRAVLDLGATAGTVRVLRHSLVGTTLGPAIEEPKVCCESFSFAKPCGQLFDDLTDIIL